MAANKCNFLRGGGLEALKAIKTCLNRVIPAGSNIKLVFKLMTLTQMHSFMTTVHISHWKFWLISVQFRVNLQFCLLKILTLNQKLLWNIRSRLNSSTFWVFRPVSTKIDIFDQNEDLDQTYLNTGSKTQNVELKVKPRSDIP